MKIRAASSVAFCLVLATCALAQNPDSSANPAPAAPSNSAPPIPGQGQGQGGGNGQRGNRGGFGSGAGMARGLSGTVTEVAADHYTIKSFTGDTYVVHFSDSTRILKQTAGQGAGPRQGQGQNQGQGNGGGRGQWAQGQGQAQGQAQGQNQGAGQGRGFGGNAPQQIKATDIKVGDAISAAGETDTAAKSVGATMIVLLDPERAKQMQATEDSYGKTWLTGKVTAIDGVKVTVDGSVDNAPHSFVADDNTTFRKRRDPITLADIQVGDTVRADGAVKDSVFTAAAVTVTGGAPGGNPTVPGPGGPANPPQ